MSEREEHEREVESLLAADQTGLRVGLEQLRGLARDGRGRTIVLGLTAAETLEYLSLYAEFALADTGPLDDPSAEARRERYYVLQDRHHAAVSNDAAENLKHWDRPEKN